MKRGLFYLCVLVVFLLVGCSSWGEYELSGEIIDKPSHGKIVIHYENGVWSCFKDLSLYYETEIGDIVIIRLYASKEYEGTGAGIVEDWYRP